MSRRSLLSLLILLCLGLSLPALAVPGEDPGNGPPTTSATATTAGNGQGNGQGNGPPTTSATATTAGNGQSNGQGNSPPTTSATATTAGNGQGNGQGNGPPTTPATTPTTGRQAPIADPATTTVTTGRVATFLAASQVPVETDSGEVLPLGESQSPPERMISWLLSANEQRFLPIVASPLVALMVIGRALTSAGSGAVAPVVFLTVVAFTKLVDRRRARGLVRSPSPGRTQSLLTAKH